MTYYFYIQDNKIIGKGQAKLLNGDNIEIHEDVYNNSEKYIYQNGEIILDPEYEAKEAQKEAERIAKLFLTGADVERGIYQAKGMDFDDILAFVMANPPQGLDVKALRIELKANNFYRGNPYVSAIGGLLGFTIGQLDKFFEFNDYTYLLPTEQVEDTSKDTSEQVEVE